MQLEPSEARSRRHHWVMLLKVRDRPNAARNAATTLLHRRSTAPLRADPLFPSTPHGGTCYITDGKDTNSWTKEEKGRDTGSTCSMDA